MTEISTSPTALTASLNLSGVNVVTNVSGQFVDTSGTTVYIGSGLNTVIIGESGSANTLDFASFGGDTTTTALIGPYVNARLMATTETASPAIARVRMSQSGAALSGVTHKLIVGFSGDAIRDYGGSLQTGAMVTATSASGGIELGSGVVIGAKVRGLNINSGAIFLGGTGANAPTSGVGLVLAPADPPIDIMVDNLNDIRVFAAASGDRVSFVGTVG